MNEIVGYVICGGIAVMCAVWGYKLHKGKWIRSIAGNTFLSKEELESPAQRELAKRVGKASYASAIFCVAIGGYEYFSEHAVEHLRIYGWFVLISVALFIGGLANCFLPLPDAQANKKQSDEVRPDRSKAARVFVAFAASRPVGREQDKFNRDGCYEDD